MLSIQFQLTQSHISSEDRTKISEERERLFQLLDSKDDEIQEQSQLVEKLKEQMLEQEELIASTRRDYENLTKEMTKIQVTMNTYLIYICIIVRCKKQVVVILVY